MKPTSSHSQSPPPSPSWWLVFLSQLAATACIAVSAYSLSLSPHSSQFLETHWASLLAVFPSVSHHGVWVLYIIALVLIVLIMPTNSIKKESSANASVGTRAGAGVSVSSTGQPPAIVYSAFALLACLICIGTLHAALRLNATEVWVYVAPGVISWLFLMVLVRQLTASLTAFSNRTYPSSSDDTDMLIQAAAAASSEKSQLAAVDEANRILA